MDVDVALRTDPPGLVLGNCWDRTGGRRESGPNGIVLTSRWLGFLMPWWRAMRPRRARRYAAARWIISCSAVGDFGVGERFWRDSSGRLTFDLARMEAADYPAACRAVADAFALAPDGPPVIGPEQMFWDFRRSEQVVGFDWDIWLGFTVVAKTEGTEPLVRDIASWLSSSQWAEVGD